MEARASEARAREARAREARPSAAEVTPDARETRSPTEAREAREARVPMEARERRLPTEARERRSSVEACDSRYRRRSSSKSACPLWMKLLRFLRSCVRSNPDCDRERSRRAESATPSSQLRARA